MSVKKCKECGNQVSTKAKKCPHCGAKAPKKTSFLTWVLALLVGLVIYGGNQSSERTTKVTASQEGTLKETAIVKQQNQSLEASSKLQNKQRDTVQRLFQSKDEPTAKDALWTSRGVFKVGVIDNGTSRDGYASYVCQVLYEHGYKGHKVWVQVIDIVKLTRNNDWVKLGESHCE